MNHVTIFLCVYKVKWKGYQKKFFVGSEKEPPKVLCRKGALKSFAIFTEKYLCWSLQHRCFPVNIAEFLGTLI